MAAGKEAGVGSWPDRREEVSATSETASVASSYGEPYSPSVARTAPVASSYGEP